MSDRTSTDPRITLAPALIAILSGVLLLADPALDGPAQTVARVVLLTTVLATTAWFGSRFPAIGRSDDRGQS